MSIDVYDKNSIAGKYGEKPTNLSFIDKGSFDICNQLMHNLNDIKKGKEIENELKPDFLANYIKEIISKKDDKSIVLISTGYGFIFEHDENCDTGEKTLCLEHAMEKNNSTQIFKITIKKDDLEEKSFLGTDEHPVKPGFTDSQIKWMEGLLSDTYNLVYQDEKTK